MKNVGINESINKILCLAKQNKKQNEFRSTESLFGNCLGLFAVTAVILNSCFDL